MQLLMPPHPLVYLIDVHVLGSQAFETTNKGGLSFKSVLESGSVFKVFFDIRHDSDALYGLFGIKVAGIIDLQVIQYATRDFRSNKLSGLAVCIEKDLPPVQGWKEVKQEGRRRFVPEQGGRYEVFLERPLLPEILQYCEQDVLLLPALLAKYAPKLFHLRVTQVQTIVDERIRLSQTPDFNSKGKHMVFGPELRPNREFKDHPRRPDVSLLRSPKLIRLCQLNESVPDGWISEFTNLHIEQDAVVQTSEGPPISAVANRDNAGDSWEREALDLADGAETL